MADKKISLEINAGVNGRESITGLAGDLDKVEEGAKGLGAAGAAAGAGVDKLGAAADKAGSEMDTAAKKTDGFKGALTQVAGAVAGAFAVGKVVDYAKSVNEVADQYKNLEARIRLAVGAQGDLQAAVAGVGKVALDTHSNLDATAELFGRLAASGKELNITNAQALGITKTINQSIQLSGAGAQASEAAVRQLVQALQSGVLRGDEFNSIMEQAPRLSKALADGLNVPVGALRALAEQGELTAAKVVGALKGQAAAINKEFATLPLTTGRALENLNTQWTLFIGSLTGGAQQSSVVAKGINALAENLDTLAGVATRAGAVLTAALAVQGVAALRAFSAEMLATGKAASLLSLELSKVPKVISITVAVTGFEIGYQIGTMLYENTELARKLGVGLVGYFEATISSLQLVKEAATAVFTSDTVSQAFDRFEKRNQQTRDSIAAMWKDAETAPTKVAGAANAGADSLGKLGGAGSAAGNAVAAGALQASGGVGAVTKASEDARSALSALAKTINTAVPAAALADIVANLQAAKARGVDLEKMLRDELPGALGKLSGAELTKFRVEFILAMNEAKVAGKTLEAGLVLIAQQAAKSLGVDTVGASNKVGAAFKDANDQLLLLIAALPDLENAGVDTAAVVGQALSNMIDGAKNQAELDAVNERINRLRTQLGDKIVDGLLDQAKQKALDLRDAMDKALPGINSAREAMSALGIDALQVSSKLTDGFKKSDEAVGVLVKEFGNLKAQGVDATAALSQGLQKLMTEAKNQADIDALTKRIESLRKLLGDKITDGLLDQAKEKALELKDATDQATGGINSVREAMGLLGVTSDESLKKTAASFKSAYDTMAADGTRSARELGEAFKRAADAAIAANKGVAPSWVEAQAATRGYKIEVDAAGKASLKAGDDAEKGSGRAANGWRAAASSARDATEAANVYRQEVAKKYGKPGEGDTKEKLGEGVSKWGGTYRNKDGMSSDAQGNVQQQFVWTRASVIDYLKQSGLDELLAERLAKQFANADGSVNYEASAAQIKWGGQYSTLAEALGKMSDYYQHDTSGKHEAQQMLDYERTNAGLNKPADAPTRSAPAGGDRERSTQGSSGSGVSSGASYVSNITINGQRRSMAYADRNSQLTGDALIRELAQAKGVAQ